MTDIIQYNIERGKNEVDLSFIIQSYSGLTTPTLKYNFNILNCHLKITTYNKLYVCT